MGREEERGEEKCQCEGETPIGCSCMCPNQDRTSNLGMCPDGLWNQWSFALQDNAQPTEPH